MPKDPESPDLATPLSEETAHRVLARAVELDARHASDVPIAKLREIAREAGIGDRALELALLEIGASVSVVASAGQQPGSDVRRWSRFAPVMRNAGAFTATMVMIGAAGRLVSPLGAGWHVEHAVAILANFVGVGVSLRVRAKLTAFVLAITAVAQLAEYPMHLLFGIETVQGGATKWALMLAAALGLGFGIAARKISGRLANTQSSGGEPVGENATEPAAAAQQSRSLLLRTT
jgi:hypothetical protein